MQFTSFLASFSVNSAMGDIEGTSFKGKVHVLALLPQLKNVVS